MYQLFCDGFDWLRATIVTLISIITVFGGLFRVGWMQIFWTMKVGAHCKQFYVTVTTGLSMIQLTKIFQNSTVGIN